MKENAKRLVEVEVVGVAVPVSRMEALRYPRPKLGEAFGRDFHPFRTDLLAERIMDPCNDHNNSHWMEQMNLRPLQMTAYCRTTVLHTT